MKLLCGIIILALVLASCDMPESRLAPLTHALSFVQRADFDAAGIRVPANGAEFEVSPAQAAVLFSQIRQRVGAVANLPASPSFTRHAVYFREVLDPTIRGARTEGGFPRPFIATVYEVVPGRAVDRSRDVFFMASNLKGPNNFPQPAAPSGRG